MITIPDWIWDQMLHEFGRTTGVVERVAYFDGVLVGRDGVVTTLAIPNAVLEPLRFTVPAEAMSQAGKHLRANNLIRLVQVHTHPTDWTDHSPYDDLRAYSQVPGSISVVLPYHAQGRPTLTQAGVHLRTDCEWRRLSPDEVDQHLRLVPSRLDFRRRV